MKIGIVGLPNVGKSTLFTALTKKKVEISNYPFCTIDPNVGVVPVPDPRLQKLAEFSRSAKIIPAIVEFVDIAGLVKGAAQGEGLGNQFLTHIREVNAIAHVVRAFSDPEITHVSGAPNPLSDIEVVEYEIILKDLETISKRLDSLEREARAGKKEALQEKTMLLGIEMELKKGNPLWRLNFQNTSKETSLSFLTGKPVIFVFNVSEDQIKNHWDPESRLKEKMGASHWIAISAKIEKELGELSADEQKEFFSDLGREKSGLDLFIQIAYKTLGLITFFTTGEDETRAWTIPKGSKAPRAGRAIHSDFEEKFIRADMIHWEKLLDAGSWSKARELGFLRTEGKEYEVRDGDVAEFKI